ncbi:unnamed protein product [Caenorhabditis auriculariae]|uniref:Cytidyltransferase-like domain-containing protein n=1 Tax=Caenorhabditis auriculariae TaxID=2777116 RepID=A0A8S1GU87_9PELO|nr:unnamed protein product [Caenorhabditis auriculariae]
MEVRQGAKTPVALLACGAFDPPTYAHMRMFERARDFLERTMSFRVVEGIISPCGDSELQSDGEEKRTAARHRLRMAETAVRRSYWIRAGDWQCSQKTTTSPLAVLQHYQKELELKYGFCVRVLLLCGSDIFEQLSRNAKTTNGSWSDTDVEYLLKNNGLVVLRRRKYHAAHEIYRTDVLRINQKGIYVIEDETFPNDVSSTRIRTAIRRGESVKYCLDDNVIDYVSEHDLYQPIFRSRRCKVSVDENRENYSTTPTTYSSSTQSTSTVIEEKKAAPEESMSRSLKPENMNPNFFQPQPPTRSSSEGRTDLIIDVQNLATSKTINALLGQEGVVTPPSSVSSTQDSSGRETSEEIPHLRSPRNKGGVGYAVIRKSTKLVQLPNNKTPTSEKKSSEPEVEAPRKKVSIGKNILSEPLSPLESPGKLHVPPLKLPEKLPKPLESPNYDNVTLDDLLEASTSWAEYMSKEVGKLNGFRPEDRRTESLPLPPPPSNSPFVAATSSSPSKKTPKNAKEKRKGWFFSRSKSWKETTSLTEEEPLVRICGTDRREQSETSPEILWRKISHQVIKGREKSWAEEPTISPKRMVCCRHPGRSPDLLRKQNVSTGSERMMQVPQSPKDVKGRRMAHHTYVTNSKSVENLTKMPPESLIEPMSRSFHENLRDAPVLDDQNAITLRFRRYRLTATPETTV